MGDDINRANLKQINKLPTSFPHSCTTPVHTPVVSSDNNCTSLDLSNTTNIPLNSALHTNNKSLKGGLHMKVLEQQNNDKEASNTLLG